MEKNNYPAQNGLALPVFSGDTFWKQTINNDTQRTDERLRG